MGFIKKVYEIERHLHNRETWFGAAAVPGANHFGDTDIMACYQSTSGNDAYGAWLQILGSDDTPVVAGSQKFDFHDILICDVVATADNALHKVQVGTGAAAAQVDITEFEFIPLRGGVALPISIMCPDIDVDTNVWVRHWVDSLNAQTMDFKAGIHEYPSYATQEALDDDFVAALALIIANPTTFKRAFQKLHDTIRDGSSDYSGIFG